MTKLGNLLRTDARQHPIEEVNVRRYSIPNAKAQDTDGVLAATARVKTTAWVASYCTVKAASGAGDTLTVKAPTMFGAAPNALKIDLKTSGDDKLSVTAATDTITINLANATASNNTAAKCQAAIRTLGAVNGIDVTAFTCAAGGNWDTAAVATGETEAKSFNNGVTGDYDVIKTGIKALSEPRNLVAKSAGTAGHIANVAVKIFGTDFDDRPIEEELPYFTADSSTTVTGTKAFKTVTEIWLPTHDGSGATTEVGFGVKFGLPHKMVNKFVHVGFDKSWDNAPTLVTDADELCKNTIQIGSHASMDGAKDVDIFIYL